MNHQNWETVVFKKASAKGGAERPAQASTGAGATVTESGKPAWKIEKQVDSEAGKPLNFVSAETAKAIVGGRVAAKLTQKQLAARLNISEKEIKDIECGKAIENKALLSKIRRALNM